MRVVSIFVLFHLLCFSSFALELTSTKIIAANSYHNVNLPPFSYFTDSSPKIDDKGNIVFDFYTIDSGKVEHGILYYDKVSNKTRPLVLLDNSEIINDVSFNKVNGSFTKSNQVIFSTHDGGAYKGLYRQDVDSSRNDFRRINLPKEDYLAINLSSFYDSQSVIRLNDSKNRELILLGKNGSTTIALEGRDDVNFLHSPKLSGKFMLYKVRFGKRGVYSKKDKENLILASTDTLNSKVILSNEGFFDRLENMYNLNRKGHIVTFVRKKNKNFIVMIKDGVTKVILDLENHPLIERVDLFTPAINNLDHVLVRGYKRDGSAAIFLYKDNNWETLIEEGHEIINQGTVYKLSKSSTGQMVKGSVDFNDDGQVVFNTYLKVDETVLEGIIKLTYE